MKWAKLNGRIVLFFSDIFLVLVMLGSKARAYQGLDRLLRVNTLKFSWADGPVKLSLNTTGSKVHLTGIKSKVGVITAQYD